MPADSVTQAARAAGDALADLLEAIALAQSAPEPPRNEPPLLLTFEAAGLELGVSRTTVFGLVRDGVLRAVTLPGMQDRRIRRSDLEDFVAGLPGSDSAGMRKARRSLTDAGPSLAAMTEPPSATTRNTVNVVAG